jgi:hypothetical protein
MTEFAKYLEGVKIKLGIKSDRELGLRIGITQPSICSIMKGLTIPTDDKCLKIAEIAGDDPEKVLLLAHKSKASEKSRPYWDSLLKKVVNMSLIIFLTLAFLPLFSPFSSPPRYIM